MSPRFKKITLFVLIICALFYVAYKYIPRIGSDHRNIDTAGDIVYLSDSYSAGKTHVWIIRSDGSGAKDLTPGNQSCSDPVFSPDGSQVAYISDKSGDQQVYVMGADGNQAHAVTYGTSAKESPQFSPDGKTITFLSHGTLTALDLQSNDTELLLPSATTATSSSTAALSDVANAPVVSYAWSPQPPNSSREPSIAAVQEDEDGDIEALTILPKMDGTPKVILSASNIGVAWSPDASQAYAALLGGQVGPQQTFSGIISFNYMGDPVQKAPLGMIQQSNYGPTDPQISPNGSQILFSVLSQPDLAHQQVIGMYLQATDGLTPPKEIVTGAVSNARWSPDGNSILMLLPSSNTGQHDLWVAQINNGSSPVNLTKGVGNVQSAAWSPEIKKASG